MSKSGPLSPWFNPRAWEWNLIPRCLRRWADVTASYQEERDNKHDVDKKLLLRIYNKCQPVYCCLTHVTFSHGSVAVLGNNCQNMFSSAHTWASWCRLRKPWQIGFCAPIQTMSRFLLQEYMRPCGTDDGVGRTGYFYVGYCGEKLLGWSNQGGEVWEVCLCMWGRGGWKYIQGFSGTQKENRRLGRHRSRREEIKRK